MRHGTAVLVLSLAALALAAGPANAHRGGFGRGIFPMPRFVNSFSNLLSTVDSACVAALNETFAVSAACRPANLTRGISKDTFCSGACGTAVDTYWTNAVSVCGTQVHKIGRNSSFSRV